MQKQRGELLHSVLAGSAAGVLGAAAMSMVMLIGKRLGFVDRPIPHRLEESIEMKAGVADKIKPRQSVVLAQTLHMLMGAGFGGIYGLLQSRLHWPNLAFGPAYGLAVYGFTEVLSGPALDLTPPPTAERPRTVVRRILMHLLYGGVLAYGAHLLAPQEQI